MSIDTTWLRCPNCFSELIEISAGVDGCTNGHRFDRSKYGFLTLLPPKAPRTIGDDRKMLTARETLLRSGAYAPIAEALIDFARDTAPPPDSSGTRIADFGCGTGYYADAVAAGVTAGIAAGASHAPPGGVADPVRLLVADRSPDAVRIALRAVPTATGIVMDIWRPFPVRDAGVDIALNVFAPRNADEFARVLVPGGALLVVVPSERHLHELRAVGAVLEVPAGKAAQVIEQFRPAGLQHRATKRVEYTLALDAIERTLVADMGPAAHHAAREAADGASTASGRTADPADRTDLADVTVSVDVLHFRRD